jgi:hypothetical protein
MPLMPRGSNRALLAAVVVGLFAAVLAVVLVTRSGATRPADGSEHSLGVASAPVVVDEWSDFE